MILSFFHSSAPSSLPFGSNHFESRTKTLESVSSPFVSFPLPARVGSTSWGLVFHARATPRRWRRKTSIPRLLWLAHRNARAHTRVGPGPRDEARRDASFSGREPLPRKGMKSSYGVASLCQSIPRVLMPAFHEFCLPSGDSSSIQRGRGLFSPNPVAQR